MQEICKQCAAKFEITDKDLGFYERISPVINGEKHQIPPPSLCPKCRVIRRMSWRNDRTFYHRKCSKTNHPIISTYAQETPFPVYEPNVWYGDSWNPMDFGQELNFNEPFFKQLEKLRMKVPRLGIDIVNCENSDFCNYCGDDKNCYLDIAGEANEDCYYNLFTKYSKNCVDCTFVYNSELMYQAINCYRCYNVYYSYYLENCSDCAFCFDLKGCKNCLFSSNLRQKEFYIFNKPYSKEEYTAKIGEFGLESHLSMQKNVLQWKNVMKSAIHRDMFNLNSENCIGNDVKNSKNCQYVFNISDCEDSKFLYDVLEAKDCYDLNYSLYKPELAYELISTLNMRSSAFSMASHYCNAVYYCDQCNNSSDLFGCIALNHKKYCILNRQYGKEEYLELTGKLIEFMKKNGEWGEFFPGKHSPFGYNETVAQEYYPLTKEQALANGFGWKDEEEKAPYSGQKTIIPDKVNETTEDIVKKILTCETCGKNYKIILQEFSYYKRLGLPVPHECPSCRHQGRLALRNPRKLWDRTCTNCKAPIQTTYAPDRPEKVYCEKCYLKAVY